jgi:ketosteroid isomerase-like protein
VPYSRAVSQGNVELVRSAFAAWNRGDIAAFASHVAPDIAWLEVSGRPESAGSGEYYGRERLQRSLEGLFEAWESYHLDVERIEAVDDRVVAIVREVARGRTSGVEIDSRWGYVITVDDDRIARVEAYRDAARALQAVGLRDSEIGA